MRAALARQHELERFLGAGLADRAGDADHFRLRARRAPRGQIAQGLQHIVDDEQRRIAPELHRASLATTTARPAPAVSAHSTKSCPSRFARDREEGVTRLQACGCRSTRR